MIDMHLSRCFSFNAWYSYFILYNDENIRYYQFSSAINKNNGRESNFMDALPCYVCWLLFGWILAISHKFVRSKTILVRNGKYFMYYFLKISLTYTYNIHFFTGQVTISIDIRSWTSRWYCISCDYTRGYKSII